MRKRFYDERVCSCSPTRGVLYLDARLLRDIVNREIHPIRCASTCGNKAKRALVVGNLCAGAGLPRWALKLWKLALGLILDKDYDDCIDVWFNTDYVRFDHAVSEGICEVIGRRIDALYRRYGYEELTGRRTVVPTGTIRSTQKNSITTGILKDGHSVGSGKP